MATVNPSRPRVAQPAPNPSAPAFLDFNAVCAVLGLPPNRKSRHFFWRNGRSGAFPAPVKIGPSKIGWRSEDIADFIASRRRVIYATAAA